MNNKNALLSLLAAAVVAFASLPLAAQTATARATEPRPAASVAASLPAIQPPVIAPQADAAIPSADEASAYGMSWKEAWHYGGFIMWILLATSVLMIALVIYFLCVFRAGAVVPRRLLAEIREDLQKGDIEAARHACELRPCPTSAIALSAIDCYHSMDEGDDRALLRDVVESEGSRQADSMQSQTQLLLDLAAIAPMLGLLGTTLGMLKAFGAVAHDVMAAAKPVLLAQGVSEAIVTTIFGLIVAIPCMAFYAFFRRRTSRLTGLLEGAATDILTSIPSHRALRTDR